MIDTNTKDKILRYFNYLLDNSSAAAPLWNLEQVREKKPSKWNYIDGCMVKSILQMYEFTGEQKYFDFAKAFVDYFVNEDGTINTYRVEELNIDT